MHACSSSTQNRGKLGKIGIGEFVFYKYKNIEQFYHRAIIVITFCTSQLILVYGASQGPGGFEIGRGFLNR